MNISTNRSEQENGGSDFEKVTSTAKKPYHTSKVERHGSLVNLTQQNINRGNDGETFWADCTLT